MSLFRRKRRDIELDEELRSHLQMDERERMERGESAEAAHHAAVREFGNVGLVKEVARQQWGWTWLEQLAQDVKYGARMLVKAPGFTLAAVITLALGIGANTALFSVVNAVLFRPLPYPHPERLVTLHMRKPNFETGAISFPNFRDWQAQNHTFTAMALARPNAVQLMEGGQAEPLRINLITSDFFDILGVKPVAGRNFRAGEDDLGRPAIALISEGLWKRRFGSAPDVVGRRINLSGDSYEVVGIVPASFELPLSYFVPTDIYLPMGQWRNTALKMRGAPLGLHGIGRIKPGTTLAQALADMEEVSRNLAIAFPDTNRDNQANLIPLKQSVTGSIQPLLLTLLGAVGFVLLIACVNVASLLLARSQARTREFAVRAALGARQVRIIRQLLTESVLLAFAGGTIGVLLAIWSTSAVLNVLPPLPRMQHIHVDWQVLAFSAAISLLAGVAFGLAPALKLAAPQLQTSLAAAGRRSTTEHHATQRSLVVMEIALALVLLTAAGLMLRTLDRLWHVDPGFDAHNVLMLGASLPPQMASAKRAVVRQGLRDLKAAMERTPGVEAVSLRNGTVPMRGDDELLFWPSGQPEPRTDSEMNWSLRYIVQPDYLKVMKIPLLRGRFFTAQDTSTSPPVVVVDDVFAKTFFPNQEVLGKRIFWKDMGKSIEGEIVGVVGHVKQWGLDSDDSNSLRAQAYLGFDQQSDDQIGVSNPVSIRTSVPPLELVQPILRSVQQVNADNAVAMPMTMEKIVEQSLASQKLAMLLLGSFAALALLLAAVGTFGVISYLVGRRTQEFGIRMALGATRGNVLLMVLREGGVLALFGVAIGMAAALGLTRLLTGMLYGVKPSDPLTYGAVALLLVAVSLAACWIPGRRAVRVDPMAALRYE
jgi:predicted permease